MMAAKDAILQVLFVLVPLLMYFFFEPLHVAHSTKRIMFGLGCSLSVLLCDTFAPQIVSGHYYGLVAVPIILSFLYGGSWPGGITAVFCFLYRLLLDREIYVTSFVFVIVILVVFLFPSSPYLKWTARQKALLLAVTLAVSSLLRLVLAYMIDPAGFLNNLAFHLFLLPGVKLFAGFSGMMMIETVLLKRQAENQVELTEKIKLAGQISASIAHEVRNPLTVIKGFLKMLETRDLTEMKRKEYLQICLKEIERAEFIINDYLRMTKPDDSAEEVFDMGDQLVYCMTFLQSFSLMNGVDISLHMQEKGVSVKGSKDKFNQVIVNIVKNAVEATKHLEDGKVGIELEPAADQALIRIRDNGAGMDRKMLEQLGRQAVSTKNAGTGLGLMVCFQIITSMGGRIEVKSKPQEGTEFAIWLPVCR